MHGVLTVSKNPLCKVGGRLDMTFADEICEIAETQATYTGAENTTTTAVDTSKT